MTEPSLSADFVFTGHGATMNYFNGLLRTALATWGGHSPGGAERRLGWVGVTLRGKKN